MSQIRKSVKMSAAIPIYMVGVIISNLTTSAQVTIDTRYLTGDPATGHWTDSTFIDFFRAPVINSQGQIAFTAQVEGAGLGTALDTGIWSEGSGSLDRVMREGSRTISMPSNAYFDSFVELVINDSGRVAFRGNLSTGSSTDDGVWSENAVSLDMIAREGDPAPWPVPSVSHNALFFMNPKFNNAGHTAFQGNVSGSGGSGSAIWLHDGATLNLLAGHGTSAPGLGGGMTFFSPFIPALNGSGIVAFQTGLAGPGVDTTNDTVIWSGGVGSLAPIVREGDPAPGLGPEFSLSGFDTVPAINDAGQTAFVGFLDGPGMTLLNNFGIWSEGSGSLDLVTRSGFAAPDTEPGVTFSVLSAPVLNGVGQTAFSAGLRGPGIHGFNGEGIWSETSGSLRLLAREGQHAPGTSPGVIYDNIDSDANGLSLNNAGQIIFRSWLVGPGVIEDVNDFGIWAAGADGVIALIARTGDLFDVNDDPSIEDLRTISDIDLDYSGSGGEDGEGVAFNDSGQLVFRLGFTDGSKGLFVADLSLEGDLNGDGFVGITDLGIVLGAWNMTIPPGDPLADPSGDGFVGIDDLTTVLGNWNAGTPPPLGLLIPEPGSLTLMGILGLSTLRRLRQT